MVENGNFDFEKINIDSIWTQALIDSDDEGTDIQSSTGQINVHRGRKFHEHSSCEIIWLPTRINETLEVIPESCHAC